MNPDTITLFQVIFYTLSHFSDLILNGKEEEEGGRAHGIAKRQNASRKR